MINIKDAYNPTRLFSVICHKFNAAAGWDKSIAKFEKPGNWGQKIPYYIYNAGAKIIITTPSHDAGRNTRRATSAIALEDTLETLKKSSDFSSGTTVIIPVAQERKYFFGLIERKHWTYLEVTKDEKDVTSARHFDSKGFLSRLYGTSHIENTIRGTFGDEVSLMSYYTGHQGLFDNINCGRFVLSYISNKVETGSLPYQASSPEKSVNKFQSYDAIVNSLESTDQNTLLKLNKNTGLNNSDDRLKDFEFDEEVIDKKDGRKGFVHKIRDSNKSNDKHLPPR